VCHHQPAAACRLHLDDLARRLGRLVHQGELLGPLGVELRLEPGDEDPKDLLELAG